MLSVCFWIIGHFTKICREAEAHERPFLSEVDTGHSSYHGGYVAGAFSGQMAASEILCTQFSPQIFGVSYDFVFFPKCNQCSRNAPLPSIIQVLFICTFFVSSHLSPFNCHPRACVRGLKQPPWKQSMLDMIVEVVISFFTGVFLPMWSNASGRR